MNDFPGSKTNFDFGKCTLAIKFTMWTTKKIDLSTFSDFIMTTFQLRIKFKIRQIRCQKTIFKLDESQVKRFDSDYSHHQ